MKRSSTAECHELWWACQPGSRSAGFGGLPSWAVLLAPLAEALPVPREKSIRAPRSRASRTAAVRRAVGAR